MSTTEKEYEYKGCHVTADLHLNAFPDNIVDIIREALKYSNLTVVSEHIKLFEPQGETGIWVLAESSATLHTYPESGILYFDAFTCGEEGNPEACVDFLLSKLDVKKSNINIFNRGEFDRNTISMEEKAREHTNQHNPEIVKTTQEKMDSIAKSLSSEQLKELNEIIDWCGAEQT